MWVAESLKTAWKRGTWDTRRGHAVPQVEAAPGHCLRPTAFPLLVPTLAFPTASLALCPHARPAPTGGQDSKDALGVAWGWGSEVLSSRTQ